MSTQKETIEFILEKLNHPKRFSARAMFGEYALYADGKVVALVCDDQLYVKIVPASHELEGVCEKDEPYPKAKPHYVVEEDRLTTLEQLPAILLAMADSLPAKKKQNKKVKDGAQCRVVSGTHAGKSGVVKDINTSKTGAITVTVLQKNGERFKTLAKNVQIR